MTKDQGFAVGAVLFLLFGAGVILASTQLGARADTSMAFALERQVRLTAALDAVRILAVADLMDDGAVDRLPLDGSVTQAYQIGSVLVRVRALAHDGLVNINSATADDLRRVLIFCGANGGEAKQATEEIVARREKTIIRSLAELLPVLQEHQSFEIALPFFTSHAQTTFNPKRAPKAVLTALGLRREGGAQPPPERGEDELGVVSLFLEATLAKSGKRMTEVVVEGTKDGVEMLDELPWDDHDANLLFGSGKC